MQERMVLAGCVVTFLVVITIILAFQFKGFAQPRRLVNLLFPLSQIAMVGLLFYYEIAYDLPEWLFLLTVIGGGLCAPIDFLLCKALKKTEDKDLSIARARLLEEQLCAQEEYTKRLAADLAKAHDIRKKTCVDLDSIDRLLVAREAQKASESLLHAVDALDGSRRRFCSHLTVDALMSLKAKACKEQGIASTFALEVPNDISLSNVELCAVFSNLLDNAISACEKVPSDKRFVSLRARVVSGFLVVDMKNSCDEALAHKGKRAFAGRHRRSLQGHGWGLSILKGLAERRNGMFEAKVVGGTFNTTIMLCVVA